MALTALAPQVSVEAYVGAGLGIIASAVGSTGGFVDLATHSPMPPGDPLNGWRIDIFYVVGTRPPTT